MVLWWLGRSMVDELVCGRWLSLEWFLAKFFVVASFVFF